MQHLDITEDAAIGLIKKSVYLAKQACKEVALETGRHYTLVIKCILNISKELFCVHLRWDEVKEDGVRCHG